MVRAGRVCAAMEKMFICICCVINYFRHGVNGHHIKAFNERIE